MKIGMVTACYKPVLNGVTRMVMLYKAHLTARGHAVTIFTLGKPDSADEADNVVRSPGIALGTTGYYVAPRFARAAQAQLAQMDVVHCHHLYMSVEFGRKYTPDHVPVVYTNHTRYDLYTATLFHLPWSLTVHYHRWMWPHRAGLADAVIAPSAELRDLMQEYGVTAPIHVIENGIDIDRFANPSASLSKRALGFAEENVVAIYVGRISAEKRIDDLLHQFARAYRHCNTLRLLLIGPGPDRTRMAQQAHQLGIASVVQIAGPVAFDLVPSYLASADFFVTASDSEVHPLTVIEALASGLPVVAYNAPGIRGTVASGVSGLLAETGELADCIAAVGENASLRRRLAQGASSVSRRFDFAKTVDQTVVLYESLR
ncbi:MAG: glycosyltransferase [Anaerolineae bacterium]|nr:glycosyltransferase [Anaerolineae bacterium]